LIAFVGIGIVLPKIMRSSKRVDEQFRKSLKGHIVFTRRNSKRVLDVWRIEANGTNEKLLFKNKDRVNSNCSNPVWAENGSRIYFTAMKNGQWKRWAMGEFGESPRIMENLDPRPGHQSADSREDDIRVEAGSIFVKDNPNPVYKHLEYDQKMNPGARKVSWSPDKESVVFCLGRQIMISDAEGLKITEITDGRDPDWKY
jgi:hypothetical protein